jgi:DNA invertase Pin-like site-specific DNA recombinase
MKASYPEHARIRAAAYVRVSTGGQTTTNQQLELERLARTRGFDIVATFEESASTSKARPVFQRMMQEAKRGVFDVVAVWSLDRFGRSMAGNVADALALDRAGVLLVSVREPWLDTGGPVRDLLLAIFSWVAEQEKRRLGERTRAALARVRERGSRSGKPIGRPRRLDSVTVTAIRKLSAEGRSARQIAMALKMPRSTVRRAIRAPSTAGPSARAE